MRWGRTLDEAVKVITSSVDSEECSGMMKSRKKQRKPSKMVFQILFPTLVRLFFIFISNLQDGWNLLSLQSLDIF